MTCQWDWHIVVCMNTTNHGSRNANRTAIREAHAAATAKATHRITWATQTEETDGMLTAHTGYEIRDCTTGAITAFVRSSEWATTAEAAADLRNAGYQPLGFDLARKNAA